MAYKNCQALSIMPEGEPQKTEWACQIYYRWTTGYAMTEPIFDSKKPKPPEQMLVVSMASKKIKRKQYEEKNCHAKMHGLCPYPTLKLTAMVSSRTGTPGSRI